MGRLVLLLLWIACVWGLSIEKKENSIVLYRLIGNDMPPLESRGQLLINTKYALEQEQFNLPRTRKRWILNRILDQQLHNEILGLLQDHGYGPEDIIDIPFESEKMCALRNSDDRMHYITNQNAARNLAYETGLRDGFRWIFVFDGNGFVSNDQWDSILGAVDHSERHNQRAMLVPMVRMHSANDATFLNSSTSLMSIMNEQPHFAEPQIGFRNDLLPSGSMPYNEDLKYGVMNKLDILDLCGFLNTRKFNDMTSKRYGSYLKKSNCHCGNFQLRSASRELLKPDDLDPTLKGYEEKMNVRHNYGMKTNVRLAKKCGLWVRLYPLPTDDAIEYANDGGTSSLSLTSKTTHCKNVGVRSLIDVIRCRASVRVEAKKQFRRELYSVCVREGYSLNPKEIGH